MLNMSSSKTKPNYHRLDNMHCAPLAGLAGSNSNSSCASSAASSFVGISSKSKASPQHDNGKSERETIHSGHFMISHFEAEEAQDDLEEDAEVKMLDPEDPNLEIPTEANTCTDVQLYVPRKLAQLQQGGQKDNTASTGLITSHLEIEVSLTKLFKCMNLAYSQKLTSPKWNHFKGVRLRWKDKIRLNNVIWRCWHMQFILKRRTPVCQFASPLDVDIHSNPQTVVLEGKYWKRQVAVIKAEYRKWRRNYKSKATGSLTSDTRSEFDFLEWSPLNDKNFMLSEDWTTDTLFSSINGPFPFPDPREIARGAGIADLIQPSLGPLQPNIEDIDITFAELLHNTRLPPVPEEGADEMLKSVEYGCYITGPEQMDTSAIMDSSNAMNRVLQADNEDANMLELNTPNPTNMQYSELEQQFNSARAVNQTAGAGSLMGASSSNNALLCGGLINTMPAEANSATSRAVITTHKPYSTCSSGAVAANEFPGKSVIKGRIAKNFQRPFRREPHNYDKAQPTMHQTNIYQQMLAEQQKQSSTQQQQLQAGNVNILQQQQNNSNMGPATFNAASQAAPTYVQNVLINANTMAANTYNFSQLLNQTPASAQSMLNVKTEQSAAESLAMFSLNAGNNENLTNFAYANSSSSVNGNINAYKPYPISAPNSKKSSSIAGYINMLQNAAAGVVQQNQQPASQVQQQQPSQTIYMQSADANNSIMLQNASQNMSGLAQIGLSPMGNSNSNLARSTLMATQLSPNNLQAVNTQMLQQQQQQQQQQHSLQQATGIVSSSSNILPKEMYRSNSLPLNASLQKLDTRASTGNLDYFVVPKYQAKSKSRVRSNSVHQHLSNNSALTNTLLAMSANNKMSTVTAHAPHSHLSSATSDPMLNMNSTLAQLLTSNNVSKQQSASTSAISTIHHMPPLTPMQPSNSNIKKTADASSYEFNNQFKKASNTSTISSNSNTSSGNMFMSSTPMTSTLLKSPSSSQEVLQQQLKNQHQRKSKVQSKSPKKSASLPAPASPLIDHSPPPAKLLSYPQSSNAVAVNSSSLMLSLSPDSVHEQDSPLSPTQPNMASKYPRDSQRRAGHIHAEQKRRYNIKNGFDLLHSLIPQLHQNPNAKLSKAAMLQKGADHIKHLRAERNLLKEKMEALRRERDSLNNSLTHLHSILPANGAPVTRQGTEHVRQLYEQYIRYRTMGNWKFWILGLILEPLLSSYTSSVSSASMEEMRRTAFLWIDQHCSLIDLRPAVSNKLKYLSMTTDILSDPPSSVQEEVAKAINNTQGQHPNLHGT